MKIVFLRLWAVWRRFRRGTRQPDRLQQAPRLEALMRRANPFASWNERANWIIDVAEWMRHEPRLSLLEAQAWRRVKHQRARFMLDWLDAHRDTRRVVQATLQKTLREAVGPELFADTGLPREPAFFSEIAERLVKLILPKPPAQMDLSALFIAMFPRQENFDWLQRLDRTTLSRLWKLVADEAISHSYGKQIDEALVYLSTMVISVGISPAFRQRLQPNLPMQATPFMALRRELEKYLFIAKPDDDTALRSVRMLIAVCQAQTEKVYAHLDEHGVSVGLVYHIERMRSQLQRMARLIDLRAAAPDSGQGALQVQSLLADLIAAHHQRSSLQALTRRSFSLLARKTVERNDDSGEQYLARDRNEYGAMLKAALAGGAVAVLTVLGRFGLAHTGVAEFFEGVLASLNFALSFLVISAIGGVLAARQPAVTAAALAAKMSVLDSSEGLRELLTEIALLLRAQAAAAFGNLLAVVPIMLVVSVAVLMLAGAPLLAPASAQAGIEQLTILGWTPLFALLTGVLLWLSSMSAGFADNWFALRRLREALTHHRRLVHALGVVRTERYARWLERHVSVIAGNLMLALLLGMTPAVAQFFGLPFDVRHVTLAAGSLTAAASSLGWGVVNLPEFWWALASIPVICLLNIGVSFGCALLVALHARAVPARLRRLVLRTALRRLVRSPGFFLLPQEMPRFASDTLPADVDEAHAPDPAVAGESVRAPGQDENEDMDRGNEERSQSIRKL